MTDFKAMTWNVENLFRPEPEAERKRYWSKIGLLADVIGRLDPAVVALQEVGGEGPLEDLQGALGGSYPHRAVSDFPDGRGIRVAFLSSSHITSFLYPRRPLLVAVSINRPDASGYHLPFCRLPYRGP